MSEYYDNNQYSMRFKNKIRIITHKLFFSINYYSYIIYKPQVVENNYKAK